VWGVQEKIVALAIAEEYANACVLTESGSAKCWGGNEWGEVGDGTTVSKSTPVNVIGLQGSAAVVSPGDNYACAVTTTGAAKCWGDSYYGQVGIGTTLEYHTTITTPADVIGLSSGMAVVSAGGEQTCALTLAGKVMCWGTNDWGALGDGSAWKLEPVNVVGFGP
jgi:alpha-tubulin suppressor-like RCC1 family protein